jgi:transposase-like protein
VDLMDNAARCPQLHSPGIRMGRIQFSNQADDKRTERQRLRWVEAYHVLRDAGAVCRRFGVSRPTLRKWLRRYEAEGAAGLRARSRRPHRSPAAKVGPAEEQAILDLRRERRLGTKRLRNELRRLHALALSPAEWVHHYNWNRSHEALGGATPIDRVCERAAKTPLWGEVSDNYEAARERIRIRDHAVDVALRSLK